ncbi:MAG: Gldg family protein [Elusimicrobia bacterium]|nr:Gldg family protein [Elusimicrobiota bacterium]
MKRTLLIFGKEIKRYFASPLAYIIIIVFLIICGWMFASTIFLINQITIDNFIMNVPLLMMFFAPAVAMQLLSGEFSSGTMEILGSLPVKDTEIIAGKFLAVFTLLSSAVILTLLYPLSISGLGNVDWGQVTGAYLGMILIGGMFLTTGMLGSSLSSNQVVAFIIGFAVSFALFIMGKVIQVVPAYMRPVIEFLGIDSHWENMSRGVIDMRDILYFLSLGFFFLYVSYMAFSRRVRMEFYNLSSAGLLAGILVLVNILVSGLVYRADLTEGNIYSISRASKKITRSLKDPVIIKVYFSRDLPQRYQDARRYLRDLLYEYRAYSGSKVQFTFLDPSGNEDLGREAMVNGIPPLKFTEAAKEKLEVKQGYMGLIIMYADRKEVIPVIENIDGLEYDLTSMIKKVTSAQTRTVGYIGEFDNPEELEADINSIYRYIEVDSEEKIDRENIYSVIVKADSRFTPDALKTVRKAAEKGIPIGIFADMYSIDMENFSAKETDNPVNGFLKEYGVEVGKGLILDTYCQRIAVTTRSGYFMVQNIIDYPYFPVISDVDKDNPIVKDINAFSLPYASPIRIEEKEDSKYKVKVLARTSEGSWLDTSAGFMTPLKEYRPSPDSEKGPFTVICSIEDADSDWRAIVVSNSRFSEKGFSSGPGVSQSLFLNIIDWLTQDSDLISIRSKGVGQRPMKEISPARKNLIRYSDIFFLPLAVLGAGIYRWRTADLRNRDKKNRILG